MLLVVRDGQGNVQTIAAQATGTPVDRSSAIASTAVSQTLMAANATRSGWIVQNTGSQPMTVSELGGDAMAANTFIVGVGQFFPPAGYVITQGAITIAGLALDTYTAREW